MKDLNGKELRPCIVSWAKYTLGIKQTQPLNVQKCTERYWRKVIDEILLKPVYAGYIINRQIAYDCYHFVSNQ